MRCVTRLYRSDFSSSRGNSWKCLLKTSPDPCLVRFGANGKGGECLASLSARHSRIMSILCANRKSIIRIWEQYGPTMNSLEEPLLGVIICSSYSKFYGRTLTTPKLVNRLTSTPTLTTSCSSIHSNTVFPGLNLEYRCSSLGQCGTSRSERMSSAVLCCHIDWLAYLVWSRMVHIPP